MDAPRRPLFAPDPVIDLLKRDVDRTLLRANLRLTPRARLEQLQGAIDGLARLRAGIDRSRNRP